MTIEYVPQCKEEIVEVVRLIPQERVQQRTVHQIVKIVEVFQIIHQEGLSQRIIDRIVHVPVVMQRQVPATQTVQKTVHVPQVQFFD